MKDIDAGYAILRRDRYLSDSDDELRSITVKRVVWDEATAQQRSSG